MISVLNNSYKDRLQVYIYDAPVNKPEDIFPTCQEKCQGGGFVVAEYLDRIIKAFYLGPDLVGITSKKHGQKRNPEADGAIKTIRDVTVYQYDPVTRSVQERAQCKLLKNQNIPCPVSRALREGWLKKEIAILKERSPITVDLIGTFIYIGKQSQKRGMVVEAFKTDLWGFLKSELSKDHRLCLKVAIEVLKIVQVLQERGRIHADLKTENFVLTVKGADVQVRVIDFAASFTKKEALEAGFRISNHNYTPGCAAPEYLALQAHYKQESAPPLPCNLSFVDTFSAGILLYEILYSLYKWPDITTIFQPRASEEEMIVARRNWTGLPRDRYPACAVWQVVCGMVEREPGKRLAIRDAIQQVQAVLYPT